MQQNIRKKRVKKNIKKIDFDINNENGKCKV